MKKVFIKSLVIYTILFCLLNYVNTSELNPISIIKMLIISILCALALSGLTVLLKANFLKNNKDKLKSNKKSQKK
ncbi:hypothetical protein ACFHWD_14180 [Clostridium sp. MT-14]|uniref:Lipopolysaccharide assembly protein A domain-containing protein n=1 Tax=Clostridium aromativorans TaxID=2836848 RepID=A0ABS8N3S3_9CLOT|nr:MULTISPECIES: hypothetical protein [Clostridium]KAA8668504.1 hypothetical protein F3O63_14530 [Clostridium sp. HV4-5-A1G]MCC9294405.1 hypothetical protein [Clostridium aromativorans]CAB1262339.1 DNA for glycosyltransferase, lytic transglycosylase, dTDP-4-rhamnose reductase [Clostridiaceae bacterium BL-3]